MIKRLKNDDLVMTTAEQHKHLKTLSTSICTKDDLETILYE